MMSRCRFVKSVAALHSLRLTASHFARAPPSLWPLRRDARVCQSVCHAAKWPWHVEAGGCVCAGCAGRSVGGG
ncbi:hypothetical protein IWX50DRAFT_467225 [Phyllosticta citricarpa]|uniref:Secreted protein n=1 Tax=Phyllosticta citricarpa TaxID=55181 RepID=A0ABR1MKZ3_9PEZI